MAEKARLSRIVAADTIRLNRIEREARLEVAREEALYWRFFLNEIISAGNRQGVAKEAAAGEAQVDDQERKGFGGRQAAEGSDELGLQDRQ
jgi:hypothetical protein